MIQFTIAASLKKCCGNKTPVVCTVSQIHGPANLQTLCNKHMPNKGSQMENLKQVHSMLLWTDFYGFWPQNKQQKDD